MRIFLLVLLSLNLNWGAALHAEGQSPLPTPAQMQETLRGPGLVGWMHGAVNGTSQWVLSYRPQGIFEAIEISLIPLNAEIEAQLRNLSRHDKVRVWGEFMRNPSPQLHLTVSRLVVENDYQAPGPQNGPVDSEGLRQALQGKSSIEAVVHAVDNDGKILVIEYQKYIVPIFNPEFAEQSKDLNRQDFVRVYFSLQENPDRPLHLRLLAGPTGKAVELLDSIHAVNGQDAVVEGQLLLFPQSPDIRFNVFAILRSEGPYHLERSYTLINFDSPERFTEIRNFLQSTWDHADQSAVVNYRNKLLNPSLRIRARGKLNHVSPSQANPQVLLESVASLEVLSAR